MINVVLYCVFCYMYQIGFMTTKKSFDKKPIIFGSLVFAPIMTPFELGVAMYCLLRK